MIEQHPTIPGVRVREYVLKEDPFTEHTTMHRTLDLYYANILVNASSRFGTVHVATGIKPEHVETVIAMIRDQADWLESQKETK